MNDTPPRGEQALQPACGNYSACSGDAFASFTMTVDKNAVASTANAIFSFIYRNFGFW